MSDSSSAGVQELAEQYTLALQEYIGRPTEALRERANQLGHAAIARGLGVLDVAAAHQEALLPILARQRAPQERAQTATRALEFLLESLAPFEMTHRGYSDTIRNLVAANAALRKSQEALHKAHDELETRVRERTAELVRANEELQVEIGERKRAEEERERLLKELEQLAEVAHRRAAEMEGVLDNMVDGVFVCGAAGRVTMVNEAGVRLTGRSRAEELKRPLAELSGLLQLRNREGTPLADGELPLARALSGQIVMQEEMVLYNPRLRRDIYTRTSAAPIRDERGKIVGAVAVARDVTELTELDRLKDEFISVAAHELKTPVTIMKGYAQALLRGTEEIPAPRRRMLGAIDRGADRIGRIVEDLLDISRLQVGRMGLRLERIDLPELVQRTLDQMPPTTSKHRIRIVRADPAVIQGDRERLEQVVINLLDNAVKYSPHGGDVEVRVERRAAEGAAGPASIVPGDIVVVSVADHGIGIPQAKQHHIFERFYRAHTGTPYDYGGMGVGLYISNEIIARHGGQMCFDSKEGVGSTFYVILPLAP